MRLSVNVPFMTVKANQIPFVGPGETALTLGHQGPL
jgi:hypothetical protein